ncbi:deoxynucleotidyltransferase terminal-interacting protein 2 [Canis lupus baileyi]|uniref:Deoxynucleotidyltransferase terminal interacting protein 2 n=3 Tax=Canis lupus TaxID=9612 RepID=A0A8C0RHW4_CANLF|nr:LOW QUALITY PROTEIN: deoxynucleotidyltransferase terminal-interacting protein 2 [Canis lupus familiaris]XP_038526003.1 deoxynucleotidyltransferase terminal-interacting protein 2 [Canis lupus familiaris]XP_547275.3 deoxynucleotidyltransferase terminal-interacting protein 2 [Canis lupus familiaris]|eukprot:XP_547275.3 deoxynucleotidyltransferase terminal-interacting protein 2 [Canis lupus familiaris]
MRARRLFDALPARRNGGRPRWLRASRMVVTRSGRHPPAREATLAEDSPQKTSAAKRIHTHSKGRKECLPVDPTTAESQTTRKQSPASRTPKTRKRKSGTTVSLPEINKPCTDGEISEAESNCSSVSELQDLILRVTRRRQILVACTPVPSVTKRPKITPAHQSPTEENDDSEAESHVSGISRIVVPTLKSTRTRRGKAKSVTDPSQDLHTEAISDAESSNSNISSFSGVATMRTRSMQKKIQAQTEEKDNDVVPENEKHIIKSPINSEDSDTRQATCLLARSVSQINEPNFYNNEIYNDFDDDSYHINSEKKRMVQKRRFNIKEGKQPSVGPLKEITKQNCKNLNEEAKGIVDEEKEINKNNSQLESLSEPQDTGIQGLVSQRHSTPQSNKTTSELSNLNCESIMKSLAQTFAVVEVDRWNEEKESTIKTGDFTEFGNGGSDEEECTVTGISKDGNEGKDVDFEREAKLFKSEFHTSLDKGDSVFLVLSSDESQQSENSENEEDTVCFVENNGQKESLNGESENMSCDNALFVIDTTPGLSTDKHFYLDERDKASEVATEEEKEEEEDEKSEEPSDHDRNEFSDEDDLLNSTKSKLLKLTSSSIDPGMSIKQLGGLYINFNANKLQSNKRTLTQIKEKKKNELLQKAVITPDFEKNYCVPPYSESKHQLQKKRRKERQKTAGDGWFGMKAPELTNELKNDLKALKMRASMDPKRFYKKNDRDGFPKYFQIGTIVDNPADFYHSRIPKKQRKRTIVEELLADSEFRRYNRRKYTEIMAEKAANAAGKKFRKKKKFRN